MSSSDHSKNVYLLTSFNPGSGKSFITFNLAISFAIKKKRVLIIDGDLRHGSASSYINTPTAGLSDILSGREQDIRKVIVSHPDYPTLDILPVGKIPPNPAELLEDDKFSKLIEQLRPLYEYIFIDCPPVDIVVDTQIIEKSADRTLFVVRAGVLERSMLDELETMYKDLNRFSL